MDKEKINAKNYKWRRKAYSQKAVSFRIDSGVPDALDAMKEQTGCSISNYIIMATTRQLIADGYLSAESMPDSAEGDEEETDLPTYTYGVRVAGDTGIPAAMDKVRESGHTVNSYIVAALREKLITDGYLSDEPKEG